MARLISSQLKRPLAICQTEFGELFVVGDAAQRPDVLLGLLLDDVDDLVVGQHADQPLAIVDHRRGDEVVALEHARHRLLVLGGADPAAVGVHQVGNGDRPLGAKQPVERNGAEQLAVVVDHVEFEEAVRQFGCVAHVVDRGAHRPGWRYRDELGLHAPAGRVLRVVQDALDGAALRRRHLLEDFVLLLLRQVLEDVRGIVGIEIADALGDGFRQQLLEDVLADGVLDLGERGEVEVAAQQLDEAGPQIGVERLDQVAGIRLVQLADQRLQGAGVVALDRRGRLLDETGADGAVLVAQRRSRRDLGHVSLLDHADLAAARPR